MEPALARQVLENYVVAQARRIYYSLNESFMKSYAGPQIVPLTNGEYREKGVQIEHLLERYRSYLSPESVKCCEHFSCVIEQKRVNYAIRGGCSTIPMSEFLGLQVSEGGTAEDLIRSQKQWVTEYFELRYEENAAYVIAALHASTVGVVRTDATAGNYVAPGAEEAVVVMAHDVSRSQNPTGRAISQSTGVIPTGPFTADSREWAGYFELIDADAAEQQHATTTAEAPTFFNHSPQTKEDDDDLLPKGDKPRSPCN